MRCFRHASFRRILPSSAAGVGRRCFSAVAASVGEVGAAGSEPTYVPQLRQAASLQVHVDRQFDRPGAAADVLQVLKKHGLNLIHLDSKLHCFAYDGVILNMDVTSIRPMHGVISSPTRGGWDTAATNLEQAVDEIRSTITGARVDLMNSVEVPWFPVSIKELHYCVEDTIGSEGGGLVSPDHPGFNDDHYKQRRSEITEAAWKFDFYADARPPVIEYTPDEHEVWSKVYTRLAPLHQSFACQEYLSAFPVLQKFAGYGPERIPQLANISDVLQSETGFRLWPVCGLLSARDFLNCLAFRVFCSTQYIRHGGNPFYTPEPDVCHELIGHVPLLADPDFAEFSQKVGLASLGASDEDIMRLANIYWFTVEFGLIKATPDGSRDDVRVIGAGILSSFGEMEWAASGSPREECREMGGIKKYFPNLGKPKLLPFEPKVAASLEYPITSYQPAYFVGDSLKAVKEQISTFCDREMVRQFHPVYDPNTLSVTSSRNVVRLPRSNEGLVQAQAEKQIAFFENLEAGK